MRAEPRHANAVLTIDLGAIVANWLQLQRRVAPAECAAVVKADAYGLGAIPVATALAAAGCRSFFVACLDEALTLRAGLPEGDSPHVYVLAGAPRGAEPIFARHGLRPVLNGLSDIEAWSNFIRSAVAAPPVAIHVDTGMSRLGLSPAEHARLHAEPERLAGISVACVMSHLACADQPDHPLNRHQHARFAAVCRQWPRIPTSFANSSGIFLGPDFHGTMCRPGAALYGVNPVPEGHNPMEQVVALTAKVLQVREIDEGVCVGYGATYRASGRTTVITVGVGYADGYHRALGNRGHAYLGEDRMPLVGRVSMDLIAFDASAVPADRVAVGADVELIGPRASVDEVATAAGTIGYEILTSLGPRYRRIYASVDSASGECR